METKEIKAAVLNNPNTGEILLMTEPHKMPADISPYKVIGYFRVREDGETVFDTANKDTALLMGVALSAFAAFVAKVQAGAAGKSEAVAWLEKLHSL
jgi:hypothetical protein